MKTGKKSSRAHWVFLLTALFLLDVSLGAIKVHPNSHQKSVLQNTVKALLAFKHVPRPEEVIRPLSKTGNPASKYMRQLFREYQGKNGDNVRLRSGNIVRSISPTIGIFNDFNTLIFNIHAVKPTEEIIRAEIHYNLRRASSKRHYGKEKKRRLREIRCIAETTTGGTFELEKLEAASDWISYDAGQLIQNLLRTDKDARKYLLSSQGNESLSSKESKKPSVPFSIRFERVNRKGKVRRIKAESALRRHTPFLLLRSNDPTLIDKAEMMSSVYDATPAFQPETVNDNDSNRSKRSVGSPVGVGHYQSYFSYNVGNGEKSHNDNIGDLNKASSSKDVDLHLQNFKNQGPEALMSRKEMRRNRKLQRKRDKYRDKNGLPYPDDYKSAKFGKEDIARTTENIHAKTNTLVDSLDDNENLGLKSQPSVVLLGGQTHGTLKETCRKWDLEVDFTDVGWAEWIIAPKTFDAHYCAGACPFPLTPESNPSNHATIQSIVHAIGLHPFVPGVCCVPDRMDSVTLLYFDEEDNVVLKNFPKMTVSSCGCL